jgi:hypothetical protein
MQITRKKGITPRLLCGSARYAKNVASSYVVVISETIAAGFAWKRSAQLFLPYDIRVMCGNGSDPEHCPRKKEPLPINICSTFKRSLAKSIAERCLRRLFKTTLGSGSYSRLLLMVPHQLGTG